MGAGDRHPVIDESGIVIGDYVEEPEPEMLWPPVTGQFAQDRAAFMIQQRIRATFAEHEKVFRVTGY